jgi:parallel beta-helix repeat protein
MNMREKPAVGRSLSIALVLLGLALVGGPLAPARAAEIECGAVLGPAGTFVLEADLGPCAESPALTVRSATLDMAGFAVSCASSNTGTGVLVDGKKAAVSNGIVTGCGVGFEVQGVKNTLSENHAIGNLGGGFVIFDAKHRLTNNEAALNSIGFGIAGSKNTLTENVAENNEVAGFGIVFGEKNRLVGNRAQGNGSESFPDEGDGFQIFDDRTLLADNTAAGNRGVGFLIGSDKNRASGNLATLNQIGIRILREHESNALSRNIALSNTADGFKLDGDRTELRENESRSNVENGFDVNGTGNELTENIAEDNGDDGFDLDGERNTLARNEANRNGGSGEPQNRNGFHVSNDFNTLIGNFARDNAEFGFAIDDGFVGNHVLKRNVATGNQAADARDLNDECVSNRWKGNEFASIDPTCIR